MANCEREITYRCFNDCKMDGCPSHKITLEFQSCSNAYKYIFEDGEELYFEQGKLQAMIDLIKNLHRVDAVDLTT